MKNAICTLWLLTFVFTACEESDRVCAPGSTRVCVCAGGVSAPQTCDADGTSWGACDCGSADTDTDMDIVTDGDTDTDSDTDTDTDTGTVVISAEWTTIPAGSFWMGTFEGTCPEGYTGTCASETGLFSDQEMLHYVTLMQSFEIMRTELTQIGFTAVMDWNPVALYDADCIYGCGVDHPVYYVSWWDTVAYANELSLDEGFSPCYVLTNVVCEDATNVGTDYLDCMNDTAGGIENATLSLNDVATPYACEGYRLPTESEWEYAIRAGSNTAFYPSDGNDGSITYTGMFPLDPNLDQIGWYAMNTTPDGAKPVGGKEANAWGLYDMSGNVDEWVWDWYEIYPFGDMSTPAVNPLGPVSASYRVIRSGHWISSAAGCLSSARGNDTPDYRSPILGVRLSRSVP